MPAQHRLGFDDQQGCLPGLDSAGEENDEAALGRSERRAFDRTVEDDELRAT